MTTEFAVLDIGIHMAASKNKRYRESVCRYFKTLITFLQEHGLTSRELLKSNESPGSTFRLMKSDLTDEGFKFIKNCLDKWTAQIESGGSTEDISVLERELARIRATE